MKAGAGIDGSKLADTSVTNAKLAHNAAWTSWTPTWTGLNTANATITAAYQQIGKTIHCRLKAVFTGAALTGVACNFTLPVTAAAAYGSHGTGIGNVYMEDLGVLGYHGFVKLISTTSADVQAMESSATYIRQANLTSTVPFTWASGDYFSLSFTYEAA